MATFAIPILQVLESVQESRLNHSQKVPHQLAEGFIGEALENHLDILNPDFFPKKILLALPETVKENINLGINEIDVIIKVLTHTEKWGELSLEMINKNLDSFDTYSLSEKQDLPSIFSELPRATFLSGFNLVSEQTSKIFCCIPTNHPGVFLLLEGDFPLSEDIQQDDVALGVLIVQS